MKYFDLPSRDGCAKITLWETNDAVNQTLSCSTSGAYPLPKSEHKFV